MKFGPRVALTRRNLAYFRWRYVSNAKRTFRAILAPPVSGDLCNIASIMTRRGIHVASSDRFLSEQGRRALDEAGEQILRLSCRDEVQAMVATGQSDDPIGKRYLISLIEGQEHSDALLRLALDLNLLQTVSLYLGMWPQLQSIDAWLNFPTDGDPKELQLWHRDPEDVKIVKVFVYLNDVDENCGPFSYIPGTHSFGELAHIVPQHRHPTRVLDDEMKSVIPAKSWLICTGPARTMIVADTLGYHRGGKPTRGKRILITFTYTSGCLFKLPFFKRNLRVSTTPTWVQRGLQEYALRA